VARVPSQTLHTAPDPITVRRLLAGANVDARQVGSWTLHGSAFPCVAGTSPYLDYPLSALPGAPDVEILIHLMPPWTAAPVMSLSAGVATAPPPVTRVVGSDPDSLFAAIDTDWMAILQLERQCQALRKQLGALHGKLQSLNRDLNTDEHRAADNADRKEWQDARRFLRDAAANVSRYMREHDIGITSNAGNRLRFEQLYEQHVVLKKPMEGLAAIQQEFESYRKTSQSVMLAMQNALGNAGKDGEQRALRVLSRIAAKTRGNRTVKGT
jgi:hypothetical protein